MQLCTEKHQTERKKWLEEKLSLIGQAKEAEDKRNHEMRKFAEDRERYTRQQSQLVRSWLWNVERANHLKAKLNLQLKKTKWKLNQIWQWRSEESEMSEKATVHQQDKTVLFM